MIQTVHLILCSKPFMKLKLLKFGLNSSENDYNDGQSVFESVQLGSF